MRNQESPIEQEIEAGKDDEEQEKKELVHEQDEEGTEISHETTHMTHNELKEHLDLLESIEGQKKRQLKADY